MNQEHETKKRNIDNILLAFNNNASFLSSHSLHNPNIIELEEVHMKTKENVGQKPFS